MNELFIEYKRTHSKECIVEYVDSLDTDYEINGFVFIPEDLREKKKYNRARIKRETEKRIREEQENGYL